MNCCTAGVRESLLSLVLTLLVCGIALASDAVVEVVDEKGTILAGFAVQPGNRWCLSWNHSVAGFPVRDCFVFQPPHMLLESSHQPDFAAGLGHVAGRGVLRPDGRGGYQIDAINEPVTGNRLILRVGAPAIDHRIEFQGRVFSLSDTVANRRVEIRLVQ